MNNSNNNELCNICMEDKDNIIQLIHLISIGDVTSHKMCQDCYKRLKTKICPFCNGKIIKSAEEKSDNIWMSINWGLEMCLPQPDFAR